MDTRWMRIIVSLRFGLILGKQLSDWWITWYAANWVGSKLTELRDWIQMKREKELACKEQSQVDNTCASYTQKKNLGYNHYIKKLYQSRTKLYHILIISKLYRNYISSETLRRKTVKYFNYIRLFINISIIFPLPAI